MTEHPSTEKAVWRDIASAPKDGTNILTLGGLHDDGGADMGEVPGIQFSFWEESSQTFYSDEWGSHQPTHWMPLPAPPAEKVCDHPSTEKAAASAWPAGQPRVVDNDKDEITVSLEGRELRGWSYASDNERRQKMLQAREYVEGWCDARQETSGLIEKFEALGPFDAETLQDLRRMVPFGLYDAGGDVTRNPLTQVYFRAGLLACREYMARFVEQGGDATTAASIRANWWPQLGDDPGPPRLFDFAEVCEESDGPDGKPQFEALEISASVEALPRAYQFLLPAAPPAASLIANPANLHGAKSPRLPRHRSNPTRPVPHRARSNFPT